jgi:hypothetical protein
VGILLIYPDVCANLGLVEEQGETSSRTAVNSPVGVSTITQTTLVTDAAQDATRQGSTFFVLRRGAVTNARSNPASLEAGEQAGATSTSARPIMPIPMGETRRVNEGSPSPRRRRRLGDALYESDQPQIRRR